MALINTGAELFVFDNGAGYSGKNYVVTDNFNQTIDLTDEANSAISAVLQGDYIPVSAMGIDGNSLTALSGYSIAAGSTTAEYAASAGYATSAFYDILGNRIDEYYATTADLDGVMNESKLEYTDGYITGYNGSAFSAQGGSEDSRFFIATYGSTDSSQDTTFAEVLAAYNAGKVIIAKTNIDWNDSYWYAGRELMISNVRYTSGNISEFVFSTLTQTYGSDVRGYDLRLTINGWASNTSYLVTKTQYDSLYNTVSALSATLSAQWALSAGSGITITNNNDTKTTVISLT